PHNRRTSVPTVSISASRSEWVNGDREHVGRGALCLRTLSGVLRAVGGLAVYRNQIPGCRVSLYDGVRSGDKRARTRNYLVAGSDAVGQQCEVERRAAT